MNQDDWYNSWQIHLEHYLKAPPRVGIYIHEHFPSIKSSLEIACGSSRDSIYLAKKGVRVTATDYEGRVIETLKRRFSHSNLSYRQADAFSLPFERDSFDMVFHNGFFVLFKSDKEILDLFTEQVRVSSKYIVFFVHNKLNQALVKRFRELAPSDPIYDVRFFEPNEVEALVKDSKINAKNVKLLKFGGKYDVFYSKRLKRVIPNLLFPFRRKIIPRLYQFQTWEETERVGCLIELNK